MADVAQIALIGTGFIGQVHAECAAKNERARLSHVFDTDSEKCGALAQRFGAVAAGTLEEALAGGCAFAIIATPTQTHGEIARACIRSGIPFLCEKPIDTELGSAIETHAEAASAGLRTGLGFNRRFDAQHAALKAHVDSGDVGNIEMMFLTSRTQSPQPLEYVASSGGLFRDKGAHFFDLACWISGKRPTAVYAAGDCLFEPAFARHGDVDTAVLTLRMEGGAFCQMNFSRRTGYGYDERIEIVGSEGMVQSQLYDPVNMHLVGYWLQGHESLSSTGPLAGFDDLVDWKFRSPPGLETEIFASFGAKPVVMDFGEVPTALRTGIVDGADASTLNTNQSLGLFDVATHVTFPGFHSMPTETLSCNKNSWNALPASIQRMIEVSLKKAALDLALQTEIKDSQVAREIAAAGVTIHDWSTEDRMRFREFARGRWEVWRGKSPAAAAIVDSHVSFMTDLGLIN